MICLWTCSAVTSIHRVIWKNRFRHTSSLQNRNNCN
jgi:hypothetical protein